MWNAATERNKEDRCPLTCWQIYRWEHFCVKNRQSGHQTSKISDISESTFCSSFILIFLHYQALAWASIRKHQTLSSPKHCPDRHVISTAKGLSNLIYSSVFPKTSTPCEFRAHKPPRKECVLFLVLYSWRSLQGLRKHSSWVPARLLLGNRGIIIYDWMANMVFQPIFNLTKLLP